MAEAAPAIPAEPSVEQKSEGLSKDLSGKTWPEIEVEPKYRSAPPQVRAQMRMMYFDGVVLPRYQKAYEGQKGGTGAGISPDQIAALRKQYDAETRESPLKYDDRMGAIRKTDLGFLPGIDYLTGIPFGDLKGFFEADNDRERYLTLSKKYGKANVGIDPGGRWWVNGKDGKRMAVVGINWLKQAGAEAASEAPEIVGMGVGALAAPETGGASVAPSLERLAAKHGITKGIPFLARQINKTMMLAARAAPQAAGAVLGKIGQETVKASQGVLDKTVAEEAAAIGKEAAGALFGEAGYRGVSAFGQRFMLDLYAHGATEAEKQLAVRALREGFHPSVAQARPGKLPLWRFGQGVYDMVFGGANKREKINYAAINKKLDSYLDSIGIKPEDRAEFKQRVLSKDFEIAEAQKDIGQPIEGVYKKLQTEIEGALDKAQREVSGDISKLAKQIGSTPHPVLAVDLENAIVGTRTQLGKVAGGRYTEIWSMGGDTGLNAPTSLLKQEATQLWERILKTMESEESTSERVWAERVRGGRWETVETKAAPDTAPGTPVNARLDQFKKQVQRILSLPDEVPMQQLAGLRTDFYNIAEDATLTPGVEKSRYRDLADKITATFHAMESHADIPGDAARKLKDTNGWYAREIQKFDAVNVVKLAREAGTTGSVKVEDIPSTIIRPGYESVIQQVRAVIGNDLFDKIAATRFADLKQQAIDPATGKFDPGKFSKVLGEYTKDGFAWKVWGEKNGAAIEKLQKEAAVLGEHIDPATLTPGTIRESVATAIARKNMNDKFWSDHLMGELAAGGARQEKAIERVVDMNSLAEIRQIKAFFGPESKEFERVRQLAMQKLLGKAIQIPDSPFGTPLSGAGFLTSLTQIGRDKLDEMFGAEITEDMFHLGDAIRYVTAKGGNALAGALRAGTLMFHPIAHLPGIIQTYIEGKVMMKPGFIKWITYGLEGDSKFTHAVAQTMRLAAYSAGQGLAARAYGPQTEYNVGSP